MRVLPLVMHLDTAGTVGKLVTLQSSLDAAFVHVSMRTETHAQYQRSVTWAAASVHVLRMLPSMLAG